MTDHLDAYLSQPPPRLEGDYRDLQHAALQELLRLSDEAIGPAVGQVEQRYRMVKDEADQRLQETIKHVEQRFAELRQQVDSQHRGELDRIETVYNGDLETLAKHTRTARERLDDELKSLMTQSRQEHEHAVWLAETVATATREKNAKHLDAIRGEIPECRKQVELLDQQARWLVQEYGLDPDEIIAASAPPVQPPPADSSANGLKSVYEQRFEAAQGDLEELEHLSVPRMFVGLWPYLYLLFLAVAGVGLAGLLSPLGIPYLPPFIVTGPLAGGGGIVVGLLIGRPLRRKGNQQVRDAYLPVHRELEAARMTLQQRLDAAVRHKEQADRQADEHRDGEVRQSTQHYETYLRQIQEKHAASIQQLDATHTKVTQEIARRHDDGRAELESGHAHQLPQLTERYHHDLAQARARHEQRIADSRRTHETDRGRLEARWQEGLAVIQRLLEETERLKHGPELDWNAPGTEQWTPPYEARSALRFGHLRVDLQTLGEDVRRLAPPGLRETAAVPLPAYLLFPKHGSLLLQAQGEARNEAIAVLRAVMVRLLTALPPGRVRFTIVDPVGLGENFAGFMHLADYDETLVGGRIWTDTPQIVQQLTDLTDHMENVIQKYLRNEYETIDAYNRQAGELAEPYRFLVIANFPAHFNEAAAQRLNSIIASGPRCGVYTLIAHDTRLELPVGLQAEDLERTSAHLVHEEGRFVWRNDVLQHFPLELDPPPSEDVLTRIMHKVGEAAKDSRRVEVPFAAIAPDDGTLWSRHADQDVRVPIGRSGATRLQELSLGKGVAQHALIAGKTGSGKSTLLHVMITNLVLWFEPNEVEFYLVDFKKGVEFKTYATHELAHARAVAIESDREFGLSVLQKIDEQMERRGELFRNAGVQDLAAYRQAAGRPLARVLLIVDEFQVFFAEDDKLSQDAALLLDRLVRQGRAFGIHVVLGSQTLGGTAGLARSTMGQMAVRIALQCSENDSQLILGDDNLAARLLNRPGEAIYNDAGGRLEANNPFQTAWLSDAQRDDLLSRVAQHARQRCPQHPRPVVFEGNAPALLDKNEHLANLLAADDDPAPPAAAYAWLGEPVAIKDPTAMRFRRQSGHNLSIVGQRDDLGLSLISASLISLSAQYAPGRVRFVVLDGSPADSPQAGELQRIASVLPHEVELIDYRNAGDAVIELASEAARRHENDEASAVPTFLLIYGLQRYRPLRRKEDDFGFSMSEEPAPPRSDKAFADLLRDGPSAGMHTITWSDTAATLERTLDRSTVGEFAHRVLFQMSANDSSNLIDSPAANRLGFHRALYYSEDEGILEKFRPYTRPSDDYLRDLKHQLRRRTSHGRR